MQHCGVCHQEGHNARRCPNRSSIDGPSSARTPRTPANRSANRSARTPPSAQLASPVLLGDDDVQLPLAAVVIRAPPSSTLLPASSVDHIDRFIVYDVETTGLSPQRDRIIQLAAVIIDGTSMEELCMLNLFVDPEGVSIDPRAERAHGLNLDALRQMVPVSQHAAARAFIDFLTTNCEPAHVCALVAHNQMSFDLRFVLQLLCRFRLHLPTGIMYAIDSLQLVRWTMKNRLRPFVCAPLPNCQLATLVAIECGRPLVGAHNALQDVRGLAAVISRPHYSTQLSSSCHCVDSVIEKYLGPGQSLRSRVSASAEEAVASHDLPPVPSDESPQAADWFAAVDIDDPGPTLVEELETPLDEQDAEAVDMARLAAMHDHRDPLDRALDEEVDLHASLEGAIPISDRVPATAGTQQAASPTAADVLQEWEQQAPGCLKRDKPAEYRRKMGDTPHCRFNRHHDGTPFGPLGIFNSLFFDAADLIVRETNRFARQKRALHTIVSFLRHVRWCNSQAGGISAATYRVRCKERAWVDLSHEELYTFIGILVQSGVDEPLSSRFSQVPCLERRAFTCHMTKLRYFSDLCVLQWESLVDTCCQVPTNIALLALRRLRGETLGGAACEASWDSATERAIMEGVFSGGESIIMTQCTTRPCRFASCLTL